MKKIICTFMCFFLVGCASLSLPNNATEEQKRVANCEDANAALLLADKMLCTVLDKDAIIYWQAFKVGALIGIEKYCSKVK